MLDRFRNLSREEVVAMFNLDFMKSRAVQEVFQEGREEGREEGRCDSLDAFRALLPKA